MQVRQSGRQTHGGLEGVRSVATGLSAKNGGGILLECVGQSGLIVRSRDNSY